MDDEDEAGDGDGVALACAFALASVVRRTLCSCLLHGEENLHRKLGHDICGIALPVLLGQLPAIPGVSPAKIAAVARRRILPCIADQLLIQFVFGEFRGDGACVPEYFALTRLASVRPPTIAGTRIARNINAASTSTSGEPRTSTAAIAFEASASFIIS